MKKMLDDLKIFTRMVISRYEALLRRPSKKNINISEKLFDQVSQVKQRLKRMTR